MLAASAIAMLATNLKWGAANHSLANDMPWVVKPHNTRLPGGLGLRNG